MKKAIILLCVALFVAVGFSGCVLPIEQQSAITDGAEPTTDAGTGGVPSGVAPPHGKPSITESETQTSTQGLLNFVASKTITITNDMNGAENSALTLKFSNGPVTVSSWDKRGYSFVITLKGYGSTPMEAEANLDNIYVDSGDDLSGGTLTLKAVAMTKSDWNGKTFPPRKSPCSHPTTR